MLLPKSALGAMWRRFRSNPAALAGLLVVLAFAACALFPSLFAGHDPAQQFRDLLLLPPAWTAGGNPAFPLGTDDLGRDLAARLVHGARASLLVGASAALLGAIPGVALGLAAAILPRIPTFFLLRLFDVLLSLPGLLLAIVVVAILGPGLENAVIAIALVSLPGYARLARAGALEQLARDYVVSARIAGAGPVRVALVHILPNIAAPLIVQTALGFSSAILDAAALGFLGLGAQPPAPEWGAMLANARDYVERAWWVVTFPGLAILLLVVAVNLIADGLRDALEPRLHNVV